MPRFVGGTSYRIYRIGRIRRVASHRIASSNAETDADESVILSRLVFSHVPVRPWSFARLHSRCRVASLDSQIVNRQSRLAACKMSFRRADCAATCRRRIIFIFCALFALSHRSLMRSALASTSAETWVVCVCGYDSYPYTYGFEAGIHKLCGKLAGSNRENLIVISPDTAAYHVKNSVPGALVHGERTITESSSNVYPNANVTYRAQDMTADLFYSILSGNETAVEGIGSEKVLKSGPQDTVVLVFINIGAYGVMTLTNNQYLYAEKLIPFLEELKENKKFKQMLILVDGQKAGSMFDGYLCSDCNIVALTNGGKRDALEVCVYNEDVSAFTSTCYTYFLMKYLDKLGKDDSSKITLFDAYAEVRRKPKQWYLESVSQLYGHLDMGNLKLSEFFQFHAK